MVLAAGLSRRMGQAKLLLPLQGRPIIRHTVETLHGLVNEVVVVTGGDDTALRGALDGLPLRFVQNPRPEQGQGTSIAVGIRALSPATRAALIVLGDQPRVPREVVIALLRHFETTDRAIVAPVYRGNLQGTPVLFRRDVFPELAALANDSGARALVQAEPARVERVAFDLAIPADVDTPEDYASLQVK